MSNIRVLPSGDLIDANRAEVIVKLIMQLSDLERAGLLAAILVKYNYPLEIIELVNIYHRKIYE